MSVDLIWSEKGVWVRLVSRAIDLMLLPNYHELQVEIVFYFNQKMKFPHTTPSFCLQWWAHLVIYFKKTSISLQFSWCFLKFQNCLFICSSAVYLYNSYRIFLYKICLEIFNQSRKWVHIWRCVKRFKFYYSKNYKFFYNVIMVFCFC